MSSPMTQNVNDEGMTVLSQNYHFICHSSEYHFHEILEYRIDYIMKGGKIVRVNHEIIGKAIFVTAEKFIEHSV